MENPWRFLVEQQPRPLPVNEVALLAGCGSTSGGSGRSGCNRHSEDSSNHTYAIPRAHASELSYERFCLDYMETNRPVVIQGASEGWSAAREWVRPDGGLDLDHLQQRFGAAQVSVTDTAREHEGAGPCRQMHLSEYLDWWRHHRQQQQDEQAKEQEGQWAVQQQAAAPSVSRQEVPDREQQEDGQSAACSTAGPRNAPTAASSPAAALAAGPLWYCKDWHLASEFPRYHAYWCPRFFRDDWLNEFYDATHGSVAAGQQPRQGRDGRDGKEEQALHADEGCQQRQQDEQQQQAGCQQQGQLQDGLQPAGVTTSDYRFVYLGPKGTCTPLHSDVLRSHSWSANVAGRKRWRLLPPRLAHLLLDRRGRDPAWDFFAADPEGMYPGLPEAQQHLITVVQQPGEAIFVPSGWFHTVENLDDCVSINHNWFNGHNVHWAWALLRRERADAEAGIDDCRQLCSPAEFESLVQRNLGANAGMDYAGFGALLRCIAGASLDCLSATAAPDDSAGDVRAALAGMQLAGRQAEAAGAGGGEPDAPGGTWYHAFRLVRAALVLQQLVEEQRRIVASYRLTQHDSAGGKEGERCGTAGAAGMAGEAEGAGVHAAPHADELAANDACLARIKEQLHLLGIEL